MERIVLASGSPRRQELLGRMGITEFDIRVPEVEERYPENLSPEEIVQYCRITTPYALLMEVTGYPPYLLTERLKTRREVKRDAPGCKIVLVVDENSESELAEQVRQAKKDGLIDQFIYGSISAGYLVALIDTL